MFRPISNFATDDKSTYKAYADSSACCNDYPSACAYSLTIPTSATVNNLKIKRKDNGEEEALTINASGTNAVRAAIYNAIKTAGYEDDGIKPNGVTSEVVGSNSIYTITGALVVVSATHSGSTVVTATQKCKFVALCDFTLEATTDSTANTFTVNGVDAALGALPFATTSAADLKTAIEGAANFPANSTVAVTKGATTFTIVINSVGSNVFALNGAKFSRSNCKQTFV